jgi:glutamate/tyrosine decarboxylase-like PLP-dependent enzyme
VAELEALRAGDADWRGGRLSMFMFSGPPEVHRIGQAAFNAYFAENALARRAFPSLARMEQEVVGMGLDLLRAPEGAAGNMTSGGTESIVMAVKTARDFARARAGDPGLRGNLVIPNSAHPAFEKAAALMDLEVRRVPVAADFTADGTAMAEAMDKNTLLLAGSAPCFPFGVFDPLPALSDLAAARGVWLHVDACVGGWLAPFARELGQALPDFDFSLSGVCSISADLHKFGFCPKPASVVFYRSAGMAAHQRFAFDVWQAGALNTETLVGTRAGGAVAAAWAVLRFMGRAGYRRVCGELLALRDGYVRDLTAIPGIVVRGRPALANIAFGHDGVDMGAVAKEMAARSWFPALLRDPPSLHLVLSMHHAPVRARYVDDLRAAIAAAPAASSAAPTASIYA